MCIYIFNNNNNRYKKQNEDKFKKRIRKGIPDAFRSQVWMEVSTAENEYIKNEYEDLLNKHSCGILKPTTATCIGGDIERDLMRTLPDLEMFQGKGTYGQHMLKRVLIAYAIKDPAVYIYILYYYNLDWLLSRYELFSRFLFILSFRNTEFLYVTYCDE